MRTYTLHVPDGAVRGDGRALDRVALVPDGFSWGAFAFSALWFFVHRLWLAGLLVLAGLIALAVVGHAAGLSPLAGTIVTLLASILIGLEATSLQRWTLARRGRPARDAVLAGSREEAELRALGRWLDAAPVRHPPASTISAPPMRRRQDEVIGFFPLTGDGR